MAPEESPKPAHSGAENRPAPDADGGANNPKKAAAPGETTAIEHAETRTEEANRRAQLAEGRTNQANTRTDEANARTAQADARTNLANVQTAEANTRTNCADLRTEKAETRSEALRDSELSYRRLFESARDGILILDADTGRITDANSFLIELLGFSRVEMLGKTVGELSPFKDIVSNQTMLERLQTHGYVRYEDLPLQTRDGRHIAVEFVSNSYLAGGRKLIQCNIRDTTERKRAEAELRAVQSQLQKTLAYSPVVIYSLNVEEGRLIARMVNENVTRVFGFSKEECLSFEFWVEHLHPEDRERELASIPDLLGGDDRPREYRLRHRDGHHIWVEDHRRIIRDDTGMPVEISGVWIEITERKRVEAELLRQSSELRARNDELTRFNRAAVGRELRMIELKREVNELCGRLGDPARHRIVGTGLPEPAIPQTPL